MESYLKCIMPNCTGNTHGLPVSTDIQSDSTACTACGSLLDVLYTNQDPTTFRELFTLRKISPQSIFDKSGVWRFRELLPFALSEGELESRLVSLDGREGQTAPYQASVVAKYVGMPASKLYLQFEGDNPTGSFKDNGMAAGFTHARMLKKRNVVCASTGNTSASMAAFAANELDMRAYVFIGSGKIAMGKLAQTLEYGARVIQIRGDFDDAMAKVQELAVSQGLYIMNSVNPFRLEGQKTIMYRMLEGLNWQVPDWVVVPGGNLGNASAFGKAFHELHEMGMIKRTPNLAIINARGANTLSQLVNEHHVSWNQGEPDTDTIRRFYNRMNAENQRAHTIASAIEINRPVNLLKALRALEWTKGIVREVEDREMLDAKAVIGRNGFGCEPASAATVAGIKLLVEEGVINPGETVVGILTGHQLKDPVAAINYHTGKNKYSNQPHEVDNTAEAIIGALD